MTIIPLDRQSIIDIAVQTSGSVEAAFTLAVKNDISISGTLVPNGELERVAVADKLVLARYDARHIRPATELSQADIDGVPYGGIELMSIEIDFIIS